MSNKEKRPAPKPARNPPKPIPNKQGPKKKEPTINPPKK